MNMVTGEKLYQVWRDLILRRKPGAEPGDWHKDLYPHERGAWNDLAKAIREGWNGS